MPRRRDPKTDAPAPVTRPAGDLSDLPVLAGTSIVTLDPGRRIAFFTPSAAKLLGLTAADAGRPLGSTPLILSVSDWNRIFDDVLDRHLTVEREVRDRKGHWYGLRVQPYRRPDAAAAGVLIVLTDIDSIRRGREQAHQARDCVEAIVEAIREPLLVLDSDLRVLHANASFLQTFGTTAEATVSRSVFSLNEGQWNIPELRQSLEQVLPGDGRIDGSPLDYEFRAIGRRRLLISARQIHHERVDNGRILLAIRDVSAQIEAREALEASEARYRAIVEDQTELICRFLPDGTLTFVNLAFCRYFGKSADELLGRSFLGMLVPQAADQEAVRSHLASFCPDNPVASFVRQMEAPRGPWREWVTRAFFDGQGSVLEFQSAGRDITKMKEQGLAVLRYQHELRALTARLTSAQESESKRLARELHDVFSQKLAVLGMEVSALEQSPPASRNALSGSLRQIAAQIGGLAGDIHQMSRQLHPTILDDLGLAAALNNECAAFAEQHGIPVHFTSVGLDDRLPEDVSLCLYRVAQECLRNVGKHAAAAEVRISLAAGPGEVTLRIEDFGDGFELQDVKGKGGLGLVSMDERVRLVNGSFRIQSAPGQGTCVEVRVPLAWRRK
jgi:PAS domain S-box-containing protein